MCILDVCSTEEKLDSTLVKITDASLEWLEQAKSSGKWWPEPEPETHEEKHILPELAGRKTKRRMIFRRWGKKSSAGAIQDKNAKEGTEGKKNKEDKNKKKEKKNEKKNKKQKLEKGWQEASKTKGSGPPVEFSPENFRKNDLGRRLIRQTIRRMFDLDMAAFKDRPLFDHMGLCRLPFDDCQGVKWISMMEKAHEYFNLESPDSKISLRTSPILSNLPVRICLFFQIDFKKIQKESNDRTIIQEYVGKYWKIMGNIWK